LFLRNAAGYRIQEEGIGEGGIRIGEIGCKVCRDYA
jgi:hypothetical protein